MPPKKKTEAQYAKQREREKQRRNKEDAVIAAEHSAAGEAGGGKIVEESAIHQRLLQLKLASIDIPSDGDCLFSALLHQAKLLPPSPATAHQVPADPLSLRRLLAEFMKKHPDDFAPFVATPILEEEKEEKKAVSKKAENSNSNKNADSQKSGDDAATTTMIAALNAYCDKIAKNNSETWGSHLELAAAASLFAVDIRVVTAERDEVVSPLKSSSSSSSTNEATTRPMWTVIHWRHKFTLGEHYTATVVGLASSPAAAASAAAPAPAAKPQAKKAKAKQAQQQKQQPEKPAEEIDSSSEADSDDE